MLRFNNSIIQLAASIKPGMSLTQLSEQTIRGQIYQYRLVGEGGIAAKGE